MTSEAPTKQPQRSKAATGHSSAKQSSKQGAVNGALLDAQPDWDRMGEIADRLLSTPPDRQAVGKALAPKQPKVGHSSTKRG